MRGSGSTRKLLLARNQIAIANGKRLEHRLHDKVCVRQLARLLFDPERLDFLTDKVIGELFLCIGKTGPGLTLHQKVTVGKPGFEQDGGALPRLLFLSR